MSYFWLGSYSLGNGSIIEPGTWGRIVRMSPMHNWALLEAVFENARLKDFPALPSRLESLFLFETEAQARQFQLQAQRPYDLVYEVELLDENAPKCVVDVALISPTANGQLLPIEQLESQASVYWASSQNTCVIPEILTMSSAKIIRRLV